jgi:DNA-binding HxlR family transcriptional regulator
MAKGYGQVCPVARALDVVGERWTLLIVRDLLQGPQRFQDLREQLAGIPPKLLSDRLRVMEEHGLLTRQMYSERPPRATYALSERGRQLGLIVGALATWGRPFVPQRGGPTHAECGHRLELAHYCSHCDARVDPATIRVALARPERGGPRGPRRRLRGKAGGARRRGAARRS